MADNRNELKAWQEQQRKLKEKQEAANRAIQEAINAARVASK